MPQFDFTTYSSQIFWFSICFALLYFCISKIILPRIQEIIANREGTINSDKTLAEQLDSKIEEVRIKTNSLRGEASKAYSTKLEEAAKTAAKQREKMIEELKIQLEATTQKSRSELRNFVEQAKAKSGASVEALVQTIKGKIFG